MNMFVVCLAWVQVITYASVSASITYCYWESSVCEIDREQNNKIFAQFTFFRLSGFVFHFATLKNWHRLRDQFEFMWWPIRLCAFELIEKIIWMWKKDITRSPIQFDFTQEKLVQMVWCNQPVSKCLCHKPWCFGIDSECIFVRSLLKIAYLEKNLRSFDGWNEIDRKCNAIVMSLRSRPGLIRLIQMRHSSQTSATKKKKIK